MRKSKNKNAKEEPDFIKAMREERHRGFDNIKTYPWPTSFDQLNKKISFSDENPKNEEKIKEKPDFIKAMIEEGHRGYDNIKTYPWPTTYEEINGNTLVASSYVKPKNKKRT